MYRQGDVLLVPVEVQTGLGKDGGFGKVVTKGRVVLADGEATGHQHVVESDSARLLEGLDGDRFLQLESEALLGHPEHREIRLPAGTFRVVRQREFDPTRHRTVAD
ncbi:MAG: hypothetical protein HYU36_18105 [Planctomycetes bacterium]|nr:hypothetical protein [Planctomycetota bacterium]